MAPNLLAPLDQLKPGLILTQYADWVYFTLVLIFFIAVAGVALRRHFDKPYVKPLIISVGLMLTVGIFRYKLWLVKIFEGWGLLGGLLLVFVAATIPFGLARGFGLPTGRAFYLSYILFYIISWVKYSEIYTLMGEHNLGLVNLALLILFFWSLYRVISFGWKPKADLGRSFDNTSPAAPQISREMDTEIKESDWVKRRAVPATEYELNSVDRMAAALTDIERTMERHRNNLDAEDRARIQGALQQMSNSENLLKQNLIGVQEIFQRLRRVDAQQLQELKARASTTTGKEKGLLLAEVAREEDKLRLEAAIVQADQRLVQLIGEFNAVLATALQRMGGSVHPYDAMPNIKKAGQVLGQIRAVLKQVKDAEKQVLRLEKLEARLLVQEKQAA